MDFQTPSIKKLLESWLDEDLGHGDLSRAALKKEIGSASWIARKQGIFCGGKIIKQLFEILDDKVSINLLINDGDHFLENERIIELNGPCRSLIAGERTSLNIAMHLSGIATATYALTQEIKGTGVSLADTRKTTPGLRVLEKYAVRCGGGINHRFGLDDTAMIKENHIAWSGGIDAAIKQIRQTAPWPSRIIVEAESSKEAKEAVIAGADGVLLDEMTPDILKELVPELRRLAENRDLRNGSNYIFIEASGIDTNELRSYAETGIDIISTSAAITRSNWIDFSMRFE